MTSKCLFLTVKCLLLIQFSLKILISAIIILDHHSTSEELHKHRNISFIFPDYFVQCHLFIPYLIIQLAGVIGLCFNHISAVIILLLDTSLGFVNYLGKYRTIDSLSLFWIGLLLEIMSIITALWFSYQLYIMWKERCLIKKAQGEVQILFNKMNGDGGDDDDDDDVVYKV